MDKVMKIGLIGTGLMGYPLAEKILENKFDLIVYNRSKEKAIPLQKLGAKIAHDLVELVQKSDLIIIMLADYPAIKEILYKSEVESEIKGKCILQMGTISPLESIEIKEFCLNQSCEYLEAPVLGSINEVKNSKLITLVGCEENQFKKYQTIFNVFGKSIHYIGEVGKASAMKLALNQLIVSLTAAFSISHSYLTKNDIDTKLFMDILRQSALYAPTFDKKLSNYEDQNFDNTNFPLQLMLKDTNLIKSEADRINIDINLLNAIEEVIKKALDRGYKDKDYSSLYMGIYDK